MSGGVRTGFRTGERLEQQVRPVQEGQLIDDDRQIGGREGEDGHLDERPVLAHTEGEERKGGEKDLDAEEGEIAMLKIEGHNRVRF